MAKKISQLTQATEVKSDDVTVIVQDGETKKLPLNMMVTKQDIENKKIAGLAKLDEIEATYENDTYTPTITVKNKSSVKTGEGDEVDYSANVMDGHVKSAILSGNTLINKLGLKTSTTNANNGHHVLLVSTQLTLPIVVGEYAIFFFESDFPNPTTDGFIQLYTNKNGNPEWIGAQQFLTRQNGKHYIIIKNTFNEQINYIDIYISNATQGTHILDNMMIITRQNGMENWDIPYFEGMQSVKLPVLKTTGKNLFDKDAITLNKCLIWLTGAEGTENNSFISDYIKVENGIHYSISGASLLASRLQVFGYDKDKKPICCFNESGGEVELGYSSGVTNNSIIIKNSYYIRVAFRNLDGVMQYINNIQLEESPTPTPYEPYKSNILTVNEEVELRGIENLRDELDCLTGELTQRIGEVVLDGSENWIKWGTDSFLYRGSIRVNETNNKILNDKLPVVDYGSIYSCTTYGIGSEYGNIGIRINNAASVEDLEMFLSQNPITVQYPLVSESIKTVDLIPSGTHPSTTPYCWKNGHIQLSSSGLLPNLEYSVVTSRAGQINQNATMIVKNDKRIFDLEILLAGGLVNTTYQALTLQNQVETGLSKVSLNSETEPDYLLYHMIMKLIEEKAYKLDDLTEKVSVFYLYEKLSDEQFETIYSALYPFVEDEIVEEPVVEELPEVVEDEVIM